MTKLSDEMIALSDEYVLGLMSQGEAELFEEIMARDEEVARRVGALRDRLLPLDLSASPRDLPEDFTARVHRAIAAQGPARRIVDLARDLPATRGRVDPPGDEGLDLRVAALFPGFLIRRLPGLCFSGQLA